MIQVSLAQVVFDEAGDTGASPRSSRYLVIAGIACSDLMSLRRAVMRTRKSLGKKLQDIPELKARHTPAKIITGFLIRLAELDIQVYAVILDKHSAKQPADAESGYRRVYVEAIKQVVADHPRSSIVMDQRYTKSSLREKLVNTILIGASSPDVALSLVFADSQQEPALQAADAVVWSIFQKYERGDATFYNIVATRIEKEILLLK